MSLKIYHSSIIEITQSSIIEITQKFYQCNHTIVISLKSQNSYIIEITQ